MYGWCVVRIWALTLKYEAEKADIANGVIPDSNAFHLAVPEFQRMSQSRKMLSSCAEEHMVN